MTWLSEIEEEIESAINKRHGYASKCETEKLCMARVIRNMAAYIKHESDTLSEDAMEVINEPAAPSST